MKKFKFPLFFAFLLLNFNQASWAMICNNECGNYEEVKDLTNISFKILKIGDGENQIRDNEKCSLWTDFVTSLAIVSNDLYYRKNVVNEQIIQAQNEKEEAQKSLDSFLNAFFEGSLGQEQIEVLYYANRLLKGSLKENDIEFVHLFPDVKEAVKHLVSEEKESQFLQTITQLRTTIAESDRLLSKKQELALMVNAQYDLGHSLELDVSRLLSAISSCSPQILSIKVLRPDSNKRCDHMHRKGKFYQPNSFAPADIFRIQTKYSNCSQEYSDLFEKFGEIMEKMDTLKTYPLVFKDLINPNKAPEPFENQLLEIKTNQFHSLQNNMFRLMSAFSVYVNEGKLLPIEEKKDIGTETF